MKFIEFINLFFINTVHADGGDEYMMGEHMFNYVSNWGMMGFFGMFFFWVVFVGVVALVIKSLTKNQESNKTALDILKERYAKGEINKAEFDKKKKDLA